VAGDNEGVMQLLIGNKNWSTWSLRPWLAMKRAGLEFEEVKVPLRLEDTPDVIRAAGSPSAKVPVLIDGHLKVWDSLAICEYLDERFPEARLWPAERVSRAHARSATAEMHSSYPSLRSQCPMDITLRTTLEPSEDTQKDIRRIVELWRDLRSRHAADGPFLVGGWSIADAFFTPVATRFRTYGVDLVQYGDDGVAQAYADLLLSQPEFLEWEKAAAGE
jgi:glutathione S-transferase